MTAERKVSLDAKRLRAMAHPLRPRLLGLLRMDGPSTATALGRRVGESSANTSWHLRQLADVGMVVEDSGRGNRRERWWAAAHDSTEMDSATLGEDSDLAGSVSSYLHAVNTMHHDRANDYLGKMFWWPKKWRAAADFSDMRLYLSAEEATELNDKVLTLMREYRREPKKGDVEFDTQWRALPIRKVSGKRPPDNPRGAA